MSKASKRNRTRARALDRLRAAASFTAAVRDNTPAGTRHEHTGGSTRFPALCEVLTPDGERAMGGFVVFAPCSANASTTRTAHSLPNHSQLWNGSTLVGILDKKEKNHGY